MNETNKPLFSESKRQIEHILPVGFAFTLNMFPYPVIVSLAVLSVFYGLYGSRLLLKGVTIRDEEREKKFSFGKFFYGFMVLCLVLVFYNRLYLAGAVWGILACGDGFSNIIGRKFGKRKLPWNTNKSWIGSTSFFVCGGLAAYLILWWLNPSLVLSKRLTLALIPAFICALVESIPWKVDDNFSVVLTGGIICFLLDG